MIPIVLKRGPLEAEILPLGATLRSLKIDGIEVLLRLDDLAAYATQTDYLNPVIGRCANRIAGGRFQIDGQAFQVSTNEDANTLHGGVEGWNRRVWTVQAEEHQAVLNYTSRDGEMGFPGMVRAAVRMTLCADNALEIVWEAEADAPTPVNLTHHLYFNLSGDPSRAVTDHALMIAADAITPVGPGLIPTGEIMAVEGTPFDFRTPPPDRRRPGRTAPATGRRRGAGQQLHPHRRRPRPAPLLPPQRRELGDRDRPAGAASLWRPGVEAAVCARRRLGAGAPRGFPDAPNHPGFPSVILRPGQTYRRRALYRLARA